MTRRPSFAMTRLLPVGFALAVAATGLAWSDRAQALSVEVWTSGGDEAVFEQGDKLNVFARASDDAHLLVYEIDAEGYVHMLFPFGNGPSDVAAKETYSLPPDSSDYDLVVQGPIGEGYIVAVASVDEFAHMPWFLRPYDPQAADLGYQHSGEEDNVEGVTEEGRVVGDPFVAMERIRRAVLATPDQAGSFATAYTKYYVHQPVKYPRYLCYDCHRPQYYSWWDGFDPYYTTCSAFSVHVNYSWWWGPSYWYGFVPYYVYTYRTTCPPIYNPVAGAAYSSWNGWSTWCNLWGGPLRRYKSSPPANYVGPSKVQPIGRWRSAADMPPGFLASHTGVSGRRELVGGGRMRAPVGGDQPVVRRLDDSNGGRLRGGSRYVPRDPGAGRDPGATREPVFVDRRRGFDLPRGRYEPSRGDLGMGRSRTGEIAAPRMGEGRRLPVPGEGRESRGGGTRARAPESPSPQAPAGGNDRGAVRGANQGAGQSAPAQTPSRGGFVGGMRGSSGRGGGR